MQEIIIKFSIKTSSVVAVSKMQFHLFLLQLLLIKYNHTLTLVSFKNDTSAKLLKFQARELGKSAKR